MKEIHDHSHEPSPNLTHDRLDHRCARTAESTMDIEPKTPAALRGGSNVDTVSRLDITPGCVENFATKT